MIFQHLNRRRTCIGFVSLFVVILIVLYMSKLGFKLNIPAIQSSFGLVEHEMKPSCINVSGNMVVGSWVKDELKQSEMAGLLKFHKKIRIYYGINQTLQLNDNKCGNVNLYGTTHRGISQFRALCDPNGTTPCCFENKCVSKTVEQCRCKNCYDLRQKIHAELSTFVPADPTCKITTFTGEVDSCKVLKGMTIYFIGDSFMRHLYIAVLSLLRSNKPNGPLIDTTPADKIQYCDKHYVITHECSSWIIDNASLCDNTTRLQGIGFWQTGQINQTLKMIKELRQQPNSMVLFSVGLHFGFNWVVVENKLLNPLLLLLGRSPWPKLVWLSAQSPGLMKSPGYSHQQLDDTVRYNLLANEFMRTKGITVLDFFQTTKTLMSYDGTHYGVGSNELKAQVLLNFILEMRTKA